MTTKGTDGILTAIAWAAMTIRHPLKANQT